jgi:hypothetical protein
MITRVVTFGFAPLAFVCIVGCASTGGMRDEPLDVGVVREFNRDYATVLRAARSAVMSVGLAIDSDEDLNDSTAIIVAKRGLHGWSWGELVRIVVQRAANDRTTVRVFSRRRMMTNILAKGDYSVTIFSDMDVGLR